MNVCRQQLTYSDKEARKKDEEFSLSSKIITEYKFESQIIRLFLMKLFAVLIKQRENKFVCGAAVHPPNRI